MKIPKRFVKATLSELDQTLFKEVIEYAKGWRRHLKEGRGLLLSGPEGIGKTYALAALTNYVRSQRYMDYQFITAPDLFEMLNPITPGKDENRGDVPWSDTLAKVRWLALNDLGKEYRAGKLGEQAVYVFGKMLRARNEAVLPVFLTTNLRIVGGEEDETLTSVYGRSIVSLLKEMTIMVHVNGKDRRK